MNKQCMHAQAALLLVIVYILLIYHVTCNIRSLDPSTCSKARFIHSSFHCLHSIDQERRVYEDLGCLTAAVQCV